MSRRIRRRINALNALLLAFVVAGAPGCTPSADGAGPPAKGKGGRRGRQRPGGARGAMGMPGAMGAGAAGMMRPGDPSAFETATGYIMKGTDMLVFWPCGKEGYYFIVPSPLANARIAQDYKFSTKRPYATMYAELKLRYVDDTISRGHLRFDRYAQVLEYTQRSRREATCKAPRTEVVSNEMERLEKFKVDVYAR